MIETEVLLMYHFLSTVLKKKFSLIFVVGRRGCLLHAINISFFGKEMPVP